MQAFNLSDCRLGLELGPDDGPYVGAPGAVSFAVWVWQPAVTRLTVTASDRDNADRLRMMASALHLTFSDLLVISPSDRVSLAVLDQWA